MDPQIWIRMPDPDARTQISQVPDLKRWLLGKADACFDQSDG